MSRIQFNPSVANLKRDAEAFANLPNNRPEAIARKRAANDNGKVRVETLARVMLAAFIIASAFAWGVL